MHLEYKAEHGGQVPLDDSNLVVQAFRFATGRIGISPPCGNLLVESEIPIGVGLGSSAAAVIAGLLLGTRCCDHDVDAQQLLRWAEEMEGHIDNAAAAYRGGLVFALCNNIDRVVTLRTSFPEDIRLIVVTPAVPVSTSKARKVLPQSYDRADVLHTLQRTALLTATCFSGKFELFPELFDDRLHQPYRRVLVPGIARCLQYRKEGLLGIAISGSGSSVIAFARANEAAIARELQQIFSAEGVDSEILFTSADNTGAIITTIKESSLQVSQ